MSPVNYFLDGSMMSRASILEYTPTPRNQEWTTHWRFTDSAFSGTQVSVATLARWLWIFRPRIRCFELSLHLQPQLSNHLWWLAGRTQDRVSLAFSKVWLFFKLSCTHFQNRRLPTFGQKKSPNTSWQHLPAASWDVQVDPWLPLVDGRPTQKPSAQNPRSCCLTFSPHWYVTLIAGIAIWKRIRNVCKKMERLIFPDESWHR